MPTLIAKQRKEEERKIDGGKVCFLERARNGTVFICATEEQAEKFQRNFISQVKMDLFALAPDVMRIRMIAMAMGIMAMA